MFDEPAENDDAAPLAPRSLRDDITDSKRGVARREAEEWQRLHEELIADGRHGHAATLLSGAAHGTGCWLYAPEYVGGRFTEDEFAEAMRSRLLSTFEPPHGRVALPCGCGAHGRRQLFDLVLSPTHPTVCSASKRIVCHRHDEMRDAILKALHRMHPGERIIKEPTQHVNPTNLPVKRPDSLATIGGVEYAVDVVVAEPAAAMHIEYVHLSSVTVPEGAARHSEILKAAEYAGTLYEHAAVPFAIESTGRPGPAARAFLLRVGAGDPDCMAALLRELAYIAARAMGQLYNHTRNRLRGLRD